MLSSLTHSPHLWVYPSRSYAPVTLEHAQLPSTPDTTLHREKICAPTYITSYATLLLTSSLESNKRRLCATSPVASFFQLFLQKHGHCGFLIILAPELSISQRQILPLPWAQHLAQSLTHIISNTEN